LNARGLRFVNEAEVRCDLDLRKKIPEHTVLEGHVLQIRLPV
jgi:hypothetical protein